jgi:hypothetical protein
VSHEKPKRVRGPNDCVVCNRPQEAKRSNERYTLPSGRVVKLCAECLRQDAMLDRRLARAEQKAADMEASQCWQAHTAY